MNASSIPNPETAGPWAEINLTALCDNYAMLKAATPGAEAAAVVKCNGYGVGMVPAARALAERARCRTFFVAYPEEGAALREALDDIAPTAAIYVFNGPLQDTLPLFGDARLTPVINSIEQAQLWIKKYPGLQCALHFDTGMNRLGAPRSAADQLASIEKLNVGVIMSHLACSYDPSHPLNEEQRTLFAKLAEKWPGAIRSLAASAGALMDGVYHYDMTRLGVALYGASPFDVDEPRLKPVVSLKAPIIQTRELAPGETVGYGATFTATRPARLALAAIGYGDGFPTGGANRAGAMINGERAIIAGRVSMDLISLDITDFKNPVATGDAATFYGTGITLFEAAKSCGAIPYELLTGLGPRVDRRYL